MIKSWKHKGLKRFFEDGITSGINAKHAKRLKIILQLLNAATHPQQLDLPGMRFHKLKGNLREYCSVTVQANWRIAFQFDKGDAILVNYLDYH